MRIGELARRTGLAPSRIRFYERVGLLTVERQANGYRSYSEEAVLALRLVTTAQRAGFSLDELRALLPRRLTAWAHGALIGTLRGKVRDIEALQAQLAQSRAHLLELMAQIEAKPADMDCATNAKRLLSEMQLGAQDGEKPAARAARPAMRWP